MIREEIVALILSGGEAVVGHPYSEGRRKYITTAYIVACPHCQAYDNMTGGRMVKTAICWKCHKLYVLNWSRIREGPDGS